MQNLFDFYQKQCIENSHTILFVKEKITYTQAFDYALARAAFLQAQGYKKGDVVALLNTNCAEWVITYMALGFIGVYAVLLDPNLNKESYQKMLQTVEAKAIFIGEAFKFDYGVNIEVFDLDLEQNIADKNNFQKIDLQEDDISSLLFTSGTTGDSKIVQLTHSNIFNTAISTINQFIKDVDITGKTFYAILPIYHVFGLVASVLAPIAGGCKIVFQTSFKGTEILKDLQEFEVNVFPAVPKIWETFFDRIVNKIKAESNLKYKVFMFMMHHAPMFRRLGLGFIPRKIFQPIHLAFGGHLDFFVSGGARLSKRVNLGYEHLGFKMIQGYGLSETVGPITINFLNDRKVDCAGKPIGGNFAEIRNNNVEGIGEVWLKGVSVFPGYYKNEEATKACFDEAGWFNSGDLGLIDKDGFLHIRGRMKNVIVLDSGKNVYPEDLEVYYWKSDQITELAVFGRKINGKESIYAVIVPEHKNKDSYQQIKKELKKLGHGLPAYKKVTQFAIAYDLLPRTSTQKIKHHEVIKNLETGVYQQASDDPKFKADELVGNTPEQEDLVMLLHDTLHTDVIYKTQRLADFEIDSLDYIELISALEKKYEIKIDIPNFIDSENMEFLFNYLSSLIEHKEKTSVTEYLLNSIIGTRIKHFYNPIIELLLFFIRIFSILLWRVEVKNKSKFQLDNNIIVANHQSYLDILWIYSFMPYRWRKHLYVAVKHEMRWLRFFLPGIHFIFVDREGAKYIPILKAEADILRQGESLIIFPEGTRSPNGKIGEFRTGAAFLAHSLKKDLIPLTIDGSYDAYPRHKRLPRLFIKKKAKMIIHDKIQPENFNTNDELNKKMREVIESGLN